MSQQEGNQAGGGSRTLQRVSLLFWSDFNQLDRSAHIRGRGWALLSVQIQMLTQPKAPSQTQYVSPDAWVLTALSS